MELRVLKYFLMVAREENITRAAQLLHVTQPTLSRQLMQLEEELGIKIFRRSNHSIVLTEDGMLLKRRAQEIVDLAEKTAKDFAHRDGVLSGEISIGSGETRSIASVGKMLASFQKKHPHIRYQLYSGNADDIKGRIESGLVDVGLLAEPVDIAKYEFARLQEREAWGILAREDSALAAKRYVLPEDLLRVPMMISGRALVQTELARWFGDVYDHLEIVFTYNLLYNAAMMVRAGMGVALCIDLDCNYEGLRFIPLFPALEMGSVIVWKKNQVFSSAASAFIEYAKKCLEDISCDAT